MFGLITKGRINIQHIKCKSYCLERMLERDLVRGTTICSKRSPAVTHLLCLNALQFQDMALLTANKYRHVYYFNKKASRRPFMIFLFIIMGFTMLQTVLAIIDNPSLFNLGKYTELIHTIVIMLPVITALVLNLQVCVSVRRLLA